MVRKERSMDFAERLETYLNAETAASAVRDYMHGEGSAAYSGAWFDTYPAPPLAGSPVGGAVNGIDSDDLIATTMLSIQVRLGSNSGFDPRKLVRFPDHAERISELLQQLPADLDLHELDEQEYATYVGAETAPAAQLWTLLRQQIELPRVATFKLLARKRPRLLPIRDGQLKAALGEQPDWWKAWWETLRAKPDIVTRLTEIRDLADAPTLSLLRVADVAVWMNGTAPRSD
jgi:hypothetical protein